MDVGKQVPTGVKVISVIYHIGAVLGILFGILFLVGAGMMGTLINQIPLLGLFAALGAGLFIIIGIIFIALGVFGFFVARGLWKVRSWARIVSIIFSIIGVLMAIFSMIKGNIVGNLFSLAFSAVIGGYLLFSNKVKEAFA